MAVMLMPETSMDKNYGPMLRENQIRSSRQTFQQVKATPTKSAATVRKAGTASLAVATHTPTPKP